MNVRVVLLISRTHFIGASRFLCDVLNAAEARFIRPLKRSPSCAEMRAIRMFPWDFIGFGSLLYRAVAPWLVFFVRGALWLAFVIF